ALGGYDGYTQTAYPYVYEYNPTTNSVQQMVSMLVSRVQFTATTLPTGKVLIVAGTDPSYTVASTEVYDPSALPNGQSAFGNPLNDGRRDHTMTLLPSGDFLVTGGYQGGHGYP